jgi:hypothetical protein
MSDIAKRPDRPGPGAIATGSSRRTADDLVALFEYIGHLPDKVQWVHRQIADVLGAPLDLALDRACAAVASTIDADTHRFDRHPYHNRQHFCEVALTAYVLCLLGQHDSRTTQFLLLAALVHDFVHAGTSSEAFVLERASVDEVRVLLENAGLEPTDMRRLTVLVLATDPSLGAEFVSAVCRAHAEGGPVSTPPPPGARELADLVTDAGLSKLARTLCEADILPSIGLNMAHAMRLQERLALEWARPLSVRDKLDFVEAVLARGLIGAYFQPNVQAMRAALAAEVDAHAEV